jgi:hypothetical protein
LVPTPRAKRENNLVLYIFVGESSGHECMTSTIMSVCGLRF